MIFVILGPTGSGKTEVGNILAKRFPNLELINSDAFQIYKDMDIGTAKIENNNPVKSRYHLLDIVSPEEKFDVATYQKMFREKVDYLLKENKDILVIGGTGLYVKAALYDYQFIETNDVDMSDLECLNNEELHAYLKEIDPQEALKIPYQNRKRVMRAIYLFRALGKRKSEIIKEQKHDLIYPDVKFYLINPDREILNERINKRTLKIIDDGLIEEAKNLKKKYVLSETSKKAIGYEEAYLFLDGKITIEEMKDKISLRTRQYAKRQMTFFLNQFNAIKYYNIENLIDDISKEIYENRRFKY